MENIPLHLKLNRLRAYIDDSNTTNSNNDKIIVLKSYENDEFVKKVLHYTYNNQLQFNVSIDNLKKNADICAPENMYNTDDGLFNLLDDLHARNITGHAAISCVNAFLKEYQKFERELGYIFDRNLQTRITATIINKVIPGLIPEFEVALGYDYDSLDETADMIEKLIKNRDIDKGKKELEKLIGTLAWSTKPENLAEVIKTKIGTKYDKRPDLTDGSYFASRKMDGLRALGFIDNEGDARFFSREGNEFTTFGSVAAHVKKMGFKNIILDGEMCLIKDDGSDDFNGMQKEFRKKNHTIENARYRIFDALTYEEFKARKSETTLSQRRARFLMNDNLGNGFVREFNEFIKPIEQIQITNQDQFQDLRDLSAEKGWEGLIVRKDMAYEGRRSKNLLKVKLFLEGEFLVVDTEMTMQRVIENGKEITKEMLGAVFVDFHGEIVRVGSGFTKEEREKFHADKHLILDKYITTQYFEATTNKQGTSKMRFPTFKCVKEKF